VAIKVVCLRREHRARLLKRTNAKDDQDVAANNNAGDDDDDADEYDDADAIPTFTTIGLYTVCRRFNLSPFWLCYIIFDAVFVCRRRIPTTVRKVRGWHEKSMVRIVHGTKSPQMVRNVYGTKSLVPGKSSTSLHGWG